ncbi:hypothetical protein E2C01_073392 [Portunus trituberculatus]|uniref:Uncharacterized protein n=1 Tax=Portunus trituberculatus TaxID=210409 RepID=A0A5B7I2V8_PORTR|nr:hypothetical protein [Portunus trituberculatus]
MSCDEAHLAYEHVAFVPLAGSGFKTEFLQSLQEVRQIPSPRWFVAYYRNGRGNFSHASRYLSKEIGTIPEGNLKKYGKGVLVRAKEITRGCCNISHAFLTACLRLLRLIPPLIIAKVVFTVKIFPEQEILAMCPSSVQKVRSRQGPRYRLEQDILQLANSQFISLGSAHRELLYRQKDSTGVTSYASLAVSSSAESAGPNTTPPVQGVLLRDAFLLHMTPF